MRVPSLFEISLKLSGFPIDEQRKALQNIPNNLQELKLYHEKKKWEIFSYHQQENLPYQGFVKAHSFNKWEDVPIIHKKQFQTGLSHWLSQNYSVENVFRNSTSGSSGVPLHFAKDKWAHARTWALIEQRYKLHDIDVFRDLEARFYGIPFKPLTKYYKERIKDFLARRYRFSVFDLSDSVLANYYQQFRHKPFVYLNGYTSSLVAFAQFIIRTGRPALKVVCPTLIRTITTSEMCDENDRALMETGFGVKVVNEYGAAELDLLAFEDAAGDWILNEENLYIEIVGEDDQPVPDGKEGRIIVTSLYNKAMPFIRYELGDRGVISTKRKGVYRILDALTGRTSDMAELPSGRKVPGLTFYYVTKSLLKENGIINEIVVHQTAPDRFKIIYVGARDLTEKEKGEIKSLMLTYLESGLSLDVERTEKIQREPSGKLKQFTKYF